MRTTAGRGAPPPAGKAARTLPCEEEGLILSITTFDGKSESKPFLKCFGHTWIGLDNRTGHTVYLKDRAIPDGEMVTFSVWAVSGLSGLLFDLEPCYIANYGRYTGRLSLSTNIGEEQLKVIEDYMEQHDKWTVDKNCSYWSIHLYNAISCFVTLYKAGHQPYLMVGAVRFSGLLHDGRHARWHLPAFGGAGVALPQGNKKTAGKDRSPVNLQISCNVFLLCALLG